MLTQPCVFSVNWASLAFWLSVSLDSWWGSLEMPLSFPCRKRTNVPDKQHWDSFYIVPWQSWQNLASVLCRASHLTKALRKKGRDFTKLNHILQKYSLILNVDIHEILYMNIPMWPPLGWKYRRSWAPKKASLCSLCSWTVINSFTLQMSLETWFLVLSAIMESVYRLLQC